MVSTEKIKEFLEGKDPEEFIVGIETHSSWTKDDSNDIYLIIDHPEKGKYIKKDQIKPFCWVKNLSKTGFYNNDRNLLKSAIKKYGIVSKKLNTGNQKRLEEGHSHLVKTTGTYRDLINFFKKGGINPFKDKDKVLMLSPQEQYLVQTGKRLFKGIDDYARLHKFIFDIETTSLLPKDGHIFLIGIKDNKGYQRILSSYDENGYNEELEKEIIIKFFESINNLKPTIITGYNSENFDFPYIFGRAEILGLNINQIVKTRHPEVKLIRRESTLKLGGEMEVYTQNLIWGYNVMDTYHAVRQAQAINSDIKEANLKYIAREAKIIKPNRVYIPGNLLGKMWMENKNYWFNPENGIWKEEFEEGYIEKSGRWLIEQYLIADLEETEKVDNIYRQSTFLIGKTIPATFIRVATMGTAAMWNSIMQAYSYESELAIPKKVETRQIVGGLSRLFRTGYNKNVVKLDYASLYPSIQITHDIFPECDINGVMKGLLQYFYDERTKYKSLMKKAKKEGDEEMEKFYDRKQLPIKILNNTMFGSLSAPNVFYWGDMDSGEMITCTGRQYLRLMTKYFLSKGYKPVVGDSVTYDSPIYVKHKETGLLDIIPICDIFDETTDKLDYSGLRDFSDKPYLILSKNGWVDIKYVYRHKTDKEIYQIGTLDRCIWVTSDHSLFQNGKQIKPKDLEKGSQIDIYEIPINNHLDVINSHKAWLMGFFLGYGTSVYGFRTKKDDTISFHGKTNKEIRSEWIINNIDDNLLFKAQKIMKQEWGVDCLIKKYSKSGTKKLKTHKKEICEFFSKNFYTSYREKKIPDLILNSNEEIKKSFLDGFFCADGYSFEINTNRVIFQKSKVCFAGLIFLLKSIGKKYHIRYRKDRNGMTISTSKKIMKYGFTDKVLFKNLYPNQDKNKYVYDISTDDGTFITGFGGIIAKNTDGMDYTLPDDIENHRYIGKGLHYMVEKGKEYKGYDADIAEFNERYMYGVMGLSLDGVYLSSVNFARKNYADKKIDGKIKLVGNTIKSKTIPKYIEKFLDKGIDLLLDGKGKEFIEYYYHLIEKLYNQEIPLIEIANKSKVKCSLDEYLNRGTDKNGKDKASQAHMELIIKEGLQVNLGDVIYYVNNGTKKSHGDFSLKTLKDGTKEKVFNCYLIPQEDIEKKTHLKGEYNVAKYIDMLNKRIEPLMVCFSPEIRNKILVNNPEERNYFTDEEMKLVSGIPMEEGDQDDLEKELIPEEREMEFWKNMNINPEYMINDRFEKEVENIY